MWLLGKGLCACVAGAGGACRRAVALTLIVLIAGFAVPGDGAAGVGAEAGREGPPESLPPPGPAPAAGSARRVDLFQLLISAGFADAVLMSDEELRQAGEHFAAGWTAPAGDLVGLLFLLPADEPRATISEFMDQLDRSCRGRFATTPERVEALEGRAVGRANAACHGKSRSLHYDMVFHFAATGTLGIVHIAFDAAARRAGEINSGLVEILASW
jgi:hypothetical protein